MIRLLPGKVACLGRHQESTRFKGMMTPQASNLSLRKEKRVRNVFIFLTLGVFMLAGCVHFNKVSTEIAPTVTTPRKYPAKTAIYFSPRLLECEVIRKPDTMYGATHEYRYLWGPSLKAALTKSAQSAYADVAVVNVPPRPGQFERVLAFDLPHVDLLVEFVPGYLSQEAKAKAVIDISIEVIDGKTMEKLRTLPVTAKGSSAKDASGFGAYSSSHFSAAMEDAIQQLSEIVSNLLISGAAEPRGGMGTTSPSNK